MNKPLDNGFDFTDKVKRYKDISLLAAGIASKFIGANYLGRDINQEEHADIIKQALGQLKGSVMKIAQLLTTVPGLIPAQYVEVLSQLQNQAPAMGWLFVKRRMKQELGPDWQKHFQDFSKTANFAASLGQVHKATLTDNVVVACKLQYPNMQEGIKIDLHQLKLLFSMYENTIGTIKTDNILQELHERLLEELDYENEQKNLTAFRAIYQQHPTLQVNVPKVHANLSTTKLLVMEWLDGKPIKDYMDHPQEIRNKIACNLFHAWYYPLYGHGLLHGDPHLGNYGVDDNYNINLYDFGCVRHFAPTFRKGIIELFYGLLHNDWQRITYGYELWGFNALDKKTLEVMNIWARFIFDPLLEDKVRLINAHHTHNKIGKEIAIKVHKQLRQISKIDMPQEFVLMDRSAMGVGAAAMLLQAKLNWHQEFLSIIQHYND